MIGSSPNVAKVASHSLSSVVSTYLCKSGISTMLLMKTAHINRLESQDGCKMCSVRNFSYRSRTNSIKLPIEFDLNDNLHTFVKMHKRVH